MAGVYAHLNSGEIALVASTAKTILQIKAPANQRLLVHGIRLFGKSAAGGTDPVVKARVTRNAANFGTGSGGVYGKNDPSDSETLQATFSANFTVEPTTPTDTGLLYEFNPQSGIIELIPPGQEWKIPGGQSLQIELTSTGTPTVACVMDIQE